MRHSRRRISGTKPPAAGRGYNILPGSFFTSRHRSDISKTLGRFGHKKKQIVRFSPGSPSNLLRAAKPQPNGGESRCDSVRLTEVLLAKRQSELAPHAVHYFFAGSELVFVNRILVTKAVQQLVQQGETFIEGGADLRGCFHALKVVEV